jgi:hypothetical protein
MGLWLWMLGKYILAYMVSCLLTISMDDINDDDVSMGLRIIFQHKSYKITAIRENIILLPKYIILIRITTS